MCGVIIEIRLGKLKKTAIDLEYIIYTPSHEPCDAPCKCPFVTVFASLVTYGNSSPFSLKSDMDNTGKPIRILLEGEG